MTHLEELREKLNDLNSQIEKKQQAFDAIITMFEIAVVECGNLDQALIAGACSVLKNLSNDLKEHQDERITLMDVLLEGGNS